MNTRTQSLRRVPLWMIAAAILLPISAATGAQNKALECVSRSDPYYDPKAKRLGQFGAVLVEYSINAKGEAEGVLVLKSAASQILEDAAVRFVSGMRCKTTEEWLQSGGPQQRLKVNVLFQFKGREPVSPVDPAEDAITITTSTPYEGK
jgi:TonB family protein